MPVTITLTDTNKTDEATNGLQSFIKIVLLNTFCFFIVGLSKNFFTIFC